MPTLTEQEEFDHLIESMFLNHPDRGIAQYAASYLTGARNEDRETVIRTLVIRELMSSNPADVDRSDPYTRAGRAFTSAGWNAMSLVRIAQHMNDGTLDYQPDQVGCAGCGVPLRVQVRHYCRRCEAPNDRSTEHRQPF